MALGGNEPQGLGHHARNLSGALAPPVRACLAEAETVVKATAKACILFTDHCGELSADD